MVDDAGSVVTVEGRIPPSDLGVTMTHEHTFIDMARGWFTEPESGPARKVAHEPVTMENIGTVRQDMMAHKDNLLLDSVETAIDEIEQYYLAGGDSIVDVTPKNVGGDPQIVRGVSRATGVQIVHGTAYYIRPAHPDRLDSMSIDDLEEEFVSDVREGIDETDVRAGIIGEIGVSGRIHKMEENVLRAAARASLRTGAPINVHPPGGKPDMPPENEIDGTNARSRWALEIMDIFDDEDLPSERVVMSHMDATLFEDIKYQKQLAERGPFLEFDVWGNENYNMSYADGYPSDEWRIETVMELIDEGYEDQLVFSQDVCYKVLLQKYGGYGYSHILEHIVPRLQRRGVGDETIAKILETNPQRALTFSEAA
jgi:phosphotriesterase-related protein